MKKSFIRNGIFLIISTAFIWQCIGAWQDSQTTDEAVHLSAGRAYWQSAAFYLNPEHPSLFKLWAALPLALTPHTQLDTNTDPWRSSNQWTIGSSYLYLDSAQWRYGTHFLLLLGRFPMILIWLGLVSTLAVFSWRRWGPWPSLIVTTLAAYDPNLLGHGHLVTNDVAVAFVYLGSFLMLNRFIQKPDWSRLWWFSLVFAVAQLTKFSAVILWVIIPFVLLVARWYKQPGLTWPWIRRAILGLIVATSLLTWVSYGFRITRISKDTRIAQLWIERQNIVDQHLQTTLPQYTQTLVIIADPGTPTGKFLNAFQHLYIPSYWYWRGLFSAISHNIYGHGAYILGHVSMLGWWYYFPVALAVKTPTLLIGILIALIILWMNELRLGIRRRLSFENLIPFEVWILGFPPLIYLLWSMTSHINLGLRHIFPTYIFFPLAAGSLIAYLQKKHARFGAVAAGSIAALAVIITTTAWPNTIGYYNGLFGGTQNGHRYVLDSNLDWNQDIWRLRSFLNKHKFSEVHIALFGSIPTDRVFPEQLPILQNQDIAFGLQPSGIIAISAGQLYNVDGPFAWLRAYQPKWRVGSSIHIYDFR